MYCPQVLKVMARCPQILMVMVKYPQDINGHGHVSSIFKDNGQVFSGIKTIKDSDYSD